MKALLATALFSVFALCGTRADEQRQLWSVPSPNNKFLAAARTITDAELVYRHDLDGFRLVIFSGGSEMPTDIYAKRDFPLRSIAHIAWSPDSQFLVFTTDSSGGHSPWHSKAFVFSVADKSFRYMDEAIGNVLNPGKFHFEPPDVAVIGVQDLDAIKKGDTFHVRWATVSLSEKISEMPNVDSL